MNYSVRKVKKVKQMDLHLTLVLMKNTAWAGNRTTKGTENKTTIHLKCEATEWWIPRGIKHDSWQKTAATEWQSPFHLQREIQGAEQIEIRRKGYNNGKTHNHTHTHTVSHRWILVPGAAWRHRAPVCSLSGQPPPLLFYSACRYTQWSLKHTHT